MDDKYLSILSDEGKAAFEAGEITYEELVEGYKTEMVRRFSKCGNFNGTFFANLNRIPEKVWKKCEPEELAELVDAFWESYSDGIAEGKRRVGCGND